MKKDENITQQFINDLVKHAIETEISKGAFYMNATVTDFANDNDLEGYEEMIEAAFEANKPKILTAKGEVFHANSDYMQSEYGIRLGQNIELACDELEAIIQTDWDKEDWFEEKEGRWADIVTLPSGKILAIVADGEWGQPSTYYHAVVELES